MLVTKNIISYDLSKSLSSSGLPTFLSSCSHMWFLHQLQTETLCCIFVWHWLYACVCAPRCNGTPFTPYMKLFRFYYTLSAYKQWLFRTWKVTWDFIFGVTNMLKLLPEPFLFLGSCFEVVCVFIFWSSLNWNSAFSLFCWYATSTSKEHQKTKNAIKSKTVLHA